MFNDKGDLSQYAQLDTDFNFAKDLKELEANKKKFPTSPLVLKKSADSKQPEI